MRNDLVVLQNIFFDNSVIKKSHLFNTSTDRKIKCADRKVFFEGENSRLSLKTPAQIFPNHHYASNTSINNINLSIGQIEGLISLKVYFNDGINSEILEIEEILDSQSGYISKEISLKKEVGYFYVVVESLQENSFVEGIKWCSYTSLPYYKFLIGITTFKREEALDANLNKIIASEELKSLDIDVMVVDNGGTVDFSKYDYPILHSAQNNSGGTGGFMRSLKYAKDNAYTHNMFMDDDIELEPEMLYRAIIFSLLTVKETTVGLMMMKKSNPSQVWEQGAFIDRNRIYTGYSFNFCMNTDSDNSLIELNKNRYSDFAGWWGCIVPTKLAPLLPYMFIKGDDVLSGLLLTKMGVPCVTLPTAMVWHEDFDKKPYTWQHYYDIRNAFLLRHFINDKTSKISMIKSIMKLFIGTLALGDYYRSGLILKAFEDGIKPADSYFSDIDNLKKTHTETMKHFPLKDVSDQVSTLSYSGRTIKGLIGAALTFFGTINPLSRNQCADGRYFTVPLNRYDISNSFKYKNVLFYDPYTYKGYVCKKNFKVAMKQFISFGKVSIKYFNTNLDKQKFLVDDNYWNDEFNEVTKNQK